jgi:hypothetical protein
MKAKIILGLRRATVNAKNGMSSESYNAGLGAVRSGRLNWQWKQKGPPASGGRPGGTHKIVLLFDPSLKNAQDKLDTICQNLPESAVTPAAAEEGQ